MSDRTVHGKAGDAEVVRYDRGGKWYIERSAGSRWHVGVADAARFVVDNDGFAHIGRPGGKVFDRAVLKLRGLA